MGRSLLRKTSKNNEENNSEKLRNKYFQDATLEPMDFIGFLNKLIRVFEQRVTTTKNNKL